MKKNGFSSFLLGACFASAVCLAYIHRRVIKAALTGEPMPEAPDWHCCHKNSAVDEVDEFLNEIDE